MKNFDFLGGNIFFHIDKSPRLTSTLGGIMTVIAGIILILLFVGFGRNFYKRINPLVLKSIDIPKEYTFIPMKNEEVSFAYRLEDYYGNQIIDDGLFYIEPTYIDQVIGESGEWEVIEEILLDQKPCVKEQFPEGSDIRNNWDVSQFTCADFQGKDFGGFWDGNRLGYFVFKVSYCSEGFESPSGVKCKPNDVKNDLLSQITYISLYYQKSVIDPMSYNKPLVKQMENGYFILDRKMTKDIYVFFQTYNIITDYGWILESKFTDTAVGAYKTRVDMYNIDNNNASKGNFLLAWYTLHYSKEVDVIVREYMKIQVLAANIGGIIKIIMVIGAAITYMYNEYKTMLEFEFISSKYFQNSKHEYLKKCMEQRKSLILKDGDLQNIQKFALNIQDNNTQYKCNDESDIIKLNENKLGKIVKTNLSQIGDINEIKTSDKLIETVYRKKSCLSKEKTQKNEQIKISKKPFPSTLSNLNSNNFSNSNKISNINNQIIKSQLQVNNNASSNNQSSENPSAIKKEIEIIDGIIKDIQEKKLHHYDNIGFCSVINFMLYTICCNGLICYSNDKKSYYEATITNFVNILELDEFIKDKIQLNRLSELVLTESQIKLIRE